MVTDDVRQDLSAWGRRLLWLVVVIGGVTVSLSLLGLALGPDRTAALVGITVREPQITLVWYVLEVAMIALTLGAAAVLLWGDRVFGWIVMWSAAAVAVLEGVAAVKALIVERTIGIPITAMMSIAALLAVGRALRRGAQRLA